MLACVDCNFINVDLPIFFMSGNLCASIGSAKLQDQWGQRESSSNRIAWRKGASCGG